MEVYFVVWCGVSELEGIVQRKESIRCLCFGTFSDQIALGIFDFSLGFCKLVYMYCPKEEVLFLLCQLLCICTCNFLKLIWFLAWYPYGESSIFAVRNGELQYLSVCCFIYFGKRYKMCQVINWINWLAETSFNTQAELSLSRFLVLNVISRSI